MFVFCDYKTINDSCKGVLIRFFQKAEMCSDKAAFYILLHIREGTIFPDTMTLHQNNARKMKTEYSIPGIDIYSGEVSP